MSQSFSRLRLNIVEQSDPLSFSLVTGTMYNSLRSIGTVIDGRDHAATGGFIVFSVEY